MDLIKKFYSYIKKNKYKVIGLSVTSIISVSYFYFSKNKIINVSLDNFIELLSENLITSIIANNGNQLYFKVKNNNNLNFTNASFIPQKKLSKMILKNPNIKLESHSSIDSQYVLLGFCIAFFFSYTYFNNVLNKNNFTETKIPNINFDDIFGLDHCKLVLKETIEYIKNPEKFINLGLENRKGILFYGKSGTGKTLLAKALAGECKVNFIYKSASEFVEKYVGVGPKRVRDLFNYARKIQPCIIFIDEWDAIGSRNNMGSNNNGEYKNTINQLLTELDGFKENNSIIIIAATNYIELIDKSLIRSKRFDLKLKIDLPNLEERIGILKLKLRKINNDLTEGNLENICLKIKDFTGADIETLVNEAGFISYRNKRDFIKEEDLLISIETILKN